MGLSSSQARLLSITARLTDNEYKSQRLTNAKMQLSNLAIEAQQNYSEALDARKLEYTNFNSDSMLTREDLTAAIIYDYQPYKNQYGLINNANQILVSRTDARNYEETNNLAEFLDRYGLLEKYEHSYTVEQGYRIDNLHYEEEYNDWKAREPQSTDRIYIIPGTEYLSYENYDKFLWTTAICYISAMSALADRLGQDRAQEFYDSQGNMIGYFDLDMPHWVYEPEPHWGTPGVAHCWSEPGGREIAIYPIFNHDYSYDQERGCYNHVLSHLLNIGSYTTTTGASFDIYEGGGGFDEPYGHWWIDHESTGPRATNAQELADLLSENADPVLYCCAEGEPDITPSSTEAEKLMSDWYIDDSGNYQIKTLQQKIVDLTYGSAYNASLPDKSIFNDQQMYDAIKHFVEKDLLVLIQEKGEIDWERFNQDYQDWLNDEPKPYTEGTSSETYTESYLEVNDKDKAQWYTNLWFRMNGYDDPATVETKERTDELDKVEYYHTMDFFGHEKNTFTKNYTIMDANLAVSKEWLHDSLKQGIITMERINSASAYQFKELKWQSIIYTNATDIIESDDEQKIAYAEAEYKAVMAEVNTKDKKFQMELRQLDSEHNAILTEYESVKAAMDKNIDRSFKAFQG